MACRSSGGAQACACRAARQQVATHRQLHLLLLGPEGLDAVCIHILLLLPAAERGSDSRPANQTCSGAPPACSMLAGLLGSVAAQFVGSHASRRSHASHGTGRHTGLVASRSLCGSQGLQAAESQRKHRQAQEEELERRAQQAGRA